jgi:hypothetical protein
VLAWSLAILVSVAGSFLAASGQRLWAQAPPAAAAASGLESLVGSCYLDIVLKNQSGVHALSGRLSFDGKGNVGALLATNSREGTFQPFAPYAGTYTATLDRTGNISLNIYEGPSPMRLAYRVNRVGSVLQLIEETPGETGKGTCTFDLPPFVASQKPPKQ